MSLPSFHVRWAGSNKLIASKLPIFKDVFASPGGHPSAWSCAMELQREVAALVKVEPTYRIKIMLGSPAGPQLTPPIKPIDSRANDEAHEAMALAWSSLSTSKPVDVFVTQHSHVDLVVYQITQTILWDPSHVASHYLMLPQDLQRHPVVALTILNVAPKSLPAELRSNKQFALAAIRQGKASRAWKIFDFFDKTLLEDEEVVREMRRMWG